MRLIDLSTAVDAGQWEADPVTHRAMSPKEGAEHMCSELEKHLGLRLDPSALPDGEFLNNDTYTLTVHTGTHVDAPAHYGSRTAYGPPRTIDQMPLEWFCRPGVVLDLRDQPTGAVAADVLGRALDRIGYQIQPLDIVLLHTGASDRVGTQRYFTDFVGLDGAAVRFLLDRGVRVIGTDAFSLDAPFPDIVRRYTDTGDQGVLWPAHLAGREREYCQIERLANLAALPAPTGFTVTVRDLRAYTGAGWLVALCGDMQTMPGYGRTPAAHAVDIDENGTTVGLF